MSPSRGQERKAGPVFAADKGRFRVTLNGATVGTEEFEISLHGDAWVARSSTDLQTPGGEMKATGELRLAPDGSPLHYQWSALAPKTASGTVDFDGGTAKCSNDLGGTKPYLQDFHFGDAHIVVLDNNFYYQYAVLARVYDWAAAGEQTFHVLIPQDLTPGSVTVKLQGSSGQLSELLVKSPDLEIHLLCDSNHRLIRLEVPSSNVVVARE
ncbi:MAG: hypothetical protein ACLP1Y_11340 [Candidatus Acidiferrales bacterium]